MAVEPEGYEPLNKLMIVISSYMYTFSVVCFKTHNSIMNWPNVKTGHSSEIDSVDFWSIYQIVCVCMLNLFRTVHSQPC